MVESRPVLKRAAIVNGSFSFAVANCPTGATNFIERSPDPGGQADWQDVFAFLTPETETNWTEPGPVPGPASFYRVRSAVGP